VIWLSPCRTICPPGPEPELLARMVLASTVKAPERINTLPPLPGPLGVLAFSRERLVIRTGARLVTVNEEVSAGLTGTSRVPATPVTWIVPAGVESVAPVVDPGAALVIVTGPPTSPNVPGTGPRLLPLTAIAIGCGVRNPKAAGGAALNVLPSGLVA